MISEKLQKAFALQFNKELYSEYLYLAMQAYFSKVGLKGFSNWMSIQVQEERAHGMGMFNYVYERGGNIELDTIEKPKTDWNSPLEVFKDTLAHEQYVTSLINQLYDVAEAEKDRAATAFLNWYIKEQVEEEANATEILSQLEIIGDNKVALMVLDEKLAQRKFQPPVIA